MVDDVFEMLWDCKYCGQKKLLGITHRFCAGCGAPQDPNARYFPPDEEKVPVRGHPYVGADVQCPACRQPMARAAKCCTNCGSPIDKGVDVARRADVVVPPPGGMPPPSASFGSAVQAAPPPKKSSTWLWALLGGGALVLLTIILVVVFWKRESSFKVTGHTWERSIAIERYETGRKSVWCDEAPAGARVLSRRREQRSTTKERDGETCQMRKKDLGNGSYKQEKECQPKYKDVPVMADKCDVEVTEWRTARTLSEKGASIADAPRWPAVRVSGGTCLGCEREGSRKETYTVRFVDEKSKKDASCDLPQTKWAEHPVGSRWKGKVRVLTDGVDCDNLGRL